jgi:tetratricopeptide (TPR) repeat protein
MAVSIPWVLLLLDWYHQRRWNKYVILDKIPFALVIFPIVAITFFSLAPNPHIKSQSLLVGLWSLTWYLEKFLLPFNLLPIYAAPFPVEIFNLHYLKAVLIFFVLGTSLWIGRQNRLFVFACVFWAATIFMFWRFDFTDKNIVADRFMYLPCIGFSLLMGKYLSRIKWASVLLLLIFSFLSYKQCAVWQNDTSLWSWIIKNDPKVTLARGNYDHIMHSSFHNIYNFKELAREIDQNPHKEGPYIVRAKALITQRNPWIALRDLNQALKINPNSLEALTIRGQMYMVQASFKEALVDMNRALELDKTNPYMYLQKGSCHLLMNQFEEAKVHFSKALALNPKLWTAYNQRAYLYVTKGQYQEAIKDFTELIKAEFELSNSYYMRGKCHEELGEYKLAIEDLKKSSSLEPNHYKISEELAILYLKNNNSESSLEVLNKSISAHPYRDNGYLERAKKHLNEKKYALVIEDCSKVIDLISNPYAALIMRGDAYLAQGEEALALKDYNRAKSLLKGTLSFEVLVSKDTSKASSIK